MRVDSKDKKIYESKDEEDAHFIKVKVIYYFSYFILQLLKVFIEAKTL